MSSTSMKIGEPYWFALCANGYGYGNTEDEAIGNAKAAGKNRTRFRVYGPCLDAHNIGCSLITGEVRWTTDKDGEALPEMKWKDVTSPPQSNGGTA